MTKTNYRKILFAVPLFIAVATLGEIGTSQSVPNPVSLRVVATQSGNYVSYVSPNAFPKLNLSQLVAQSTDIITGTAGTNVCRLSADGTFITTDFQVIVQSIQKGRLQVGSAITVSLPGGKTGFKQPDGSMATAEIRTPWLKKMTNGSSYVIFLTAVDSDTTPAGPLTANRVARYTLAGGPAGLFQITSGLVMSNSGRLRDPMWQYNNMSLSVFKQRTDEAQIMSAPAIPQP